MIFEAYSIWGNTVVDLLVALSASAGHAIGTTGTALTWAALQNGAYSFKNDGNPSDVLALLTLKGVQDLAADSLSLGGAIQMSAQMQQFLNTGVSGAFIGRFMNGIDIYLNSELDTSGGDTLGFMFSDEGVATKHQIVPIRNSGNPVINAGFFSQEIRRPGGGVDRYSTAMYVGVGINQDHACRRIIYSTT
jgi:hypothetical protein